MKISKSRLNQVIKEEVKRFLQERGNYGTYGNADGESKVINMKNMKIRVDLDDIDYRKTQHSDERQDRHKKDGGGGFGISSKSINNAIDMAIGDVINDYANGELKNGERFLIVAKTGSGIPLNIVAALDMKKGPDDMGVITVMRKDDFKSDLPRYFVSA